MSRRKLTQFDKIFCQGYSCAVANLIRLHGEGTEAEDTYKQNFLSVSELKTRGVDAGDIKVLRPMIREIERRRNN